MLGINIWDYLAVSSVGQLHVAGNNGLFFAVLVTMSDENLFFQLAGLQDSPLNRGWGGTTTEVCRENWWNRTALEEHGVKAGIRTGRWQRGRACRQITWPTAARVSVSEGDTDTKIKTTNCCRRESLVHLSWFGRIKTVRVYYDQWICRKHQG